ncbi:MAG: response regulator transcription factor [Christensenellaceae bacterium]|nr:response regulator transcription factor [Christensenellaceae bacterium]
MKKIYCVEDDPNIRDLVCYALAGSGFEATGCADGRQLDAAMGQALPDMVILDIMLPEEDGLSILARLRKAPDTMDIPILMLTAKTGEIDRVKGLDMGADDYMVKPFSVLEMVSRVKAVLRRCGNVRRSSVSHYGEITVDRDKRSVTAGGVACPLTFKEFELLCYLMENEGIVLTREKILERVWGFEYAGESRTVDMHIKTLRHKLGSAGSSIITVRGVGYKLGE